MKRIAIGMAIVVFVVCLASCNPDELPDISEPDAAVTSQQIEPTPDVSPEPTPDVSPDAEPETEPLPVVTLETPIPFASYYFDGDIFPQYEGYHLELEMTEGSYDATQEMWNRMWSGTFRFRCYTSWNEYNTFDRGDFVISEAWCHAFNSTFDFSFDDYNNDGCPDFAIAQLGSYSGGDIVVIYTLREDGIVEQLPVTGDNRRISAFGLISEDEYTTSFLIPYRHVGPSPALTKTEDGFIVSYLQIHAFESATMFSDTDALHEEWISEHDNVSSDWTQVDDVYEWQGDAFVKVNQIIYNEDGSVWKQANPQV